MTLDDLRRRIDVLDGELVRLLGERAELVLHIGRLKRESGRAVHQPERESAVLDNVRSVNQGPLSNEALGRLFRAMMEEFKRLQQDHEPDQPVDS